MHYPQYAIFYDFHTLPAIKNIGGKFDIESFTKTLADNQVDYLVFHARDNMGAAYYDTKIGTRHPNLNYDLFGKLAQSCYHNNIRICAYFNAGLSYLEALSHPEWETRQMNPLPYGSVTPYLKTMCYNSAYREHLKSMATEVATRYPVSGFFFDCMERSACGCQTCINLMKDNNLDWRDIEVVKEFSAQSAKKLADELASQLKAVNPEYLIYFNGVGFEEQQNSGTYLEFECIPTKAGSNYDYLQVLGRYMRTLSDKPLLNMTGRFYRWGDFGSLRPRNAIRSELLNGLANGLRPSVGDHMLPDCDYNTPSFRQTLDIYRELRTFEPWTRDAKAVAEIAIFYPKKHRNLRFDTELYGAVRMLCELHCQFDVITLSSSLMKYKLIVIPDSVEFTPDVSERVREYLHSGGKIISSGTSGLYHDKIALPEFWQIQAIGKCDFTPAYFEPDQEYMKDLPEMPLSIYADGWAFQPLQCEVVSKLVKPQINFEYDGVFPCYYTPPGEISELPFITVTNSNAHFSHKLFTGYRMQGAIQLRTIFRNVLEKMLPQPLIKAPKLPEYARLTLTSQRGRTMIHILAQIPEKRAMDCEIIEEDLTVRPFLLYIRKDQFSSPLRVYTAPEKKPLNVSEFAGYYVVDVPEFTGYILIVMEEITNC